MEGSTQNRLFSAIITIALHAVIAYFLITGLNIDVVNKTSSSLKVSNIAPLPPPDPPPPLPKLETVKEVKPQGAASPKNIKSKAAPKEAPKPIVKVKPRKPVVVAEKADTGTAPIAGNSDKPGQGSGAGGQGNGTGAGGTGSGAGGVKIRSRATYISGRIKNSDYPREASKTNASGSVIVRYTVMPNGRVTGCRVTQSSGNADLDSTTCRLIEKRFRYEPARDTNGNAIDDVTGWKQDWWFEGKSKRDDNPQKP